MIITFNKKENFNSYKFMKIIKLLLNNKIIILIIIKKNKTNEFILI